jgi:hypothetical protein
MTPFFVFFEGMCSLSGLGRSFVATRKPTMEVGLEVPKEVAVSIERPDTTDEAKLAAAD